MGPGNSNKKDTEYYELMTAVVHELKTPITTIKEAISLLSEINYSKFDTQSKKILKIAEEELDRLVEIVNNLLKISAAKSGNWKLKKAPYKIEEIIKEILKNYSLLTKRKKLYIKTKFATNTPKVLVDRERIYEAIANIIDNGIKFSPEGGKIQITTQLLSGKSLKLENPAIDPQKKYLKITITDNGPGIPKEKLPLIFEGTNIKETTGIPLNLGLGLIITKKIIEMHNGVIWAESNNGAKFSLALPINNKN